MSTWLIVGASRGIGLEFARQLIARGDQVIATIRDQYKASELWQLSAQAQRPGALQLYQCDVTDEASISAFVARVASIPGPAKIDYLILNAGVLKYPNLLERLFSCPVIPDLLSTFEISRMGM
ncbi:MAG: hypothetical protein Q9160_003331 [Pyrenula sp. 1 TL-2023]